MTVTTVRIGRSRHKYLFRARLKLFEALSSEIEIQLGNSSEQMMRVAGLVELSLLMMRKNNDRKNTMLHQPTLVGLWQREEDNGDDPATSREKKRIRVSSIETFPQNDISPPLPSPRWENISLPNGPMYLLRGCIGGKNSLERRLTRESLASLPDWNENVKFKIFGKDCQMRRVSVSIPDGDGDHHAAFTIIPHHLCILINKQRICQYSTGGKVSYSYSGLVRKNASP